MNLFATSPEWIVWLLVALLVAAMVQDAVQLKISNIISGSVLVLAGVAMAASGFRIALWQNVLVFAVLLTIGAFLFERNVLGGGDIKLFAAIGLWVDLASAARLLGCVAIAGGLLALLIIFLRTIAPKRLAAHVKTLQPRAGIPYGIAIAAGTLLVLSFWSQPPRQVPYVPVNLPAKASTR